MWFWWMLLICDVIIPLTMIIAGRIMWKKCPKKINGIYGYRTERSMVNMDTWKFAHDHCGRLWFKWGFIALIPSVAAHLPFYHSGEDTVGIVSIVVMSLQCILLIASLFPTEAALKKNFNPDGTPKH